MGVVLGNFCLLEEEHGDIGHGEELPLQAQAWQKFSF